MKRIYTATFLVLISICSCQTQPDEFEWPIGGYRPDDPALPEIEERLSKADYTFSINRDSGIELYVESANKWVSINANALHELESKSCHLVLIHKAKALIENEEELIKTIIDFAQTRKAKTVVVLTASGFLTFNITEVHKL